MLLAAALTLATLSDPAAPAEQPATEVPTRQQLRRRAIGLGIASGAFSITWVGLKVVGTVNDPVEARVVDSKLEGHYCIESCYVGTIFNPIGAPMLIATAGLLGGSMHAYGRRLAHDRSGLGRTRRKGVVLASVGGGLLGAGLLGIGLGVGLQRIAPNAVMQIRSREIGWWSGAALGVTGAALLGLGHGIIRGHRERKHGIAVAFAPMIGGRITGFSIAGRF